jgi:uncharacterized protein YabN with tetrapyrrole methylase and pyrophosphatase domain
LELPGEERPFERLVAIMAALRADDGCPWDRAQDLESLLAFMGSEYEEVREAVSRGEPAAIREELGDLLYNVVFMARVAEERGWFDIHDVARAIGDKLIRRHEYVFEAPRRVTLDEANRLWREAKAREKEGP